MGETGSDANLEKGLNYNIQSRAAVVHGHVTSSPVVLSVGE